jgi:hypothetical protein
MRRCHGRIARGAHDPYETSERAATSADMLRHWPEVRDSRFRVVGLEAVQKTSIVGNCGSAVRQSHR